MYSSDVLSFQEKIIEYKCCGSLLDVESSLIECSFDHRKGSAYDLHFIFWKKEEINEYFKSRAIDFSISDPKNLHLGNSKGKKIDKIGHDPILAREQ